MEDRDLMAHVLGGDSSAAEDVSDRLLAGIG